MMLRLLFLLFFCSIGARAATVRGTLVGPDERPVPGATIWVAGTGRSEYSEKDGSLRRLASDEKGAFTFEMPDGAHVALLRVLATGFAMRDKVLQPGENLVRLQVAKVTQGLVQDTNGHPVANARVRLSSAFGWDYFEDDLLSDSSDFLSSIAFRNALPRLETRSDADGKWTLPDVNEGYVILDDDRFAQDLRRAAPEIKLVKLRAAPGASLQGRILTPDGKPLAGVFVNSNSFFTPQRTDAEGRFLLTNLPTQPYNLTAIAPDTDWLVPWLTLSAPLKAGEINQAPAWTATRGMEVTGQLVDKNGGAPLDGIEIPAQGRQHVVTDAEGRFRVRLVPEQAQIYVSVPRFMALYKTLDIPPNAATFDAGHIELQRATMVTGHLTDEKGAPLENFTLSAVYESGRSRAQTTVTSDEAGAFTVKVPLGQVTFQVSRQAFRSGDERELTPDKAVEVTITENMAPLRFAAKKMPILAVLGRIVTPSRLPVADVRVVIQAETPSEDKEGSSLDYKTTQTDTEGRFSVGFLPGFKTLKIYAATKIGHQLTTPGAATLKNGAWEFGDSVLAALNARVSGRVVDVNGAPLAGALVQCADRPKFSLIATGADGRFELQDLPDGEVTLLAAHGRNFGSATGKFTEIEIQALPPSVIVTPMQRQFFAQLSKDDFYPLTRYWDVIGTERMLALALQKDGALPPGEFATANANWAKTGESTLRMLLMADRHDLDWLLANGVTILERVPPGKNLTTRFALETELATLAGWRGSEAMRAWANRWLENALKQKDALNAPGANAARWFSFAGVAGALGHADAKQMALTALNFAAQADPKQLDENAFSWGGDLARGGPEIFALLENEWPVSARLNALFGAVAQLSGLDLERGTIFIEKERALAAKSEKPAPEGGEPQSQTTEWQWRSAQVALEPLAVLDWVEKTRPDDWRLRGAIARELLKRGDRENVRRTLKPALEEQAMQRQSRGASGQTNSRGFLSYFGALAKPFDAELSQKFFEKSQEAINLPEFSSPHPHYDYYWAFEDPTRTRLWLEHSLAQEKVPGHTVWRDHWPAYLAGAMLVFDEVRALDMLVNGPDGPNGDKSSDRAHIAAYFLADETTRLTLRSVNDY